MGESALQIENLVFGAREWTTAACILAAIVTMLAVWSYAVRNQLSGLRFVAMLLKVAAVGALAFCLLEPLRRQERPRPGANVMALVVDNSRSMEMRPPGQVSSRIERITGKLRSDAAWQSRLAQDFDVRRYAFDERLRAVEELESLEFDGNSSSLAEAITTLQSRFASRPVAGVLLFTDGLATDGVSSLLSESEFDFPIYPVVVGEQAKLRDVAIVDTSVNMSSFELAPAGVEATLKAIGLSGESVVVRLINAAGETLEKQTVACDSHDFEARIRFQFLPSEPGFQIVQLRAMLDREDSDKAQVKSRTEVTTANNSRLLAVDRGGGPYRILYVAGRPNWEFKFLRRALEEDVELDLQGLVRIAKQEPKFSFRDRGIETANPLMAGFGDDEETVEQYDEPVLLRLGVNEDELKSGFPSGEADLFSYHAIILDDVEASFFSQQQMLLMREFVAERGGGFMMLGGQESFLGGGYRDTPLGDVLPVYLRGFASGKDKSGPVRYRLTREGGLEPWLRLRANQSDERTRVDEMPDFLTWNAAAEVKPGASVLAQLTTPEGMEPGLVAQRFGNGRALALLVGDFWRWSMRRATEETDDLAQSWRQIARWLTNDVPRRVASEIVAPESVLEPHRLLIRLRDPAYKPLENATVTLKVTEPDGQEVTASATPDDTRAGLYVTDYWSKLDGGYQCVVEATGPDGEELDSLRTGWTAEPSAIEFARVKADQEILQEIADASGGQLVPIDELESFVATLPTRKVPITESRVEPLWHRPWFVIFAIGCLCLEWGLRRWKGLP